MRLLIGINVNILLNGKATHCIIVNWWEFSGAGVAFIAAVGVVAAYSFFYGFFAISTNLILSEKKEVSTRVKPPGSEMIIEFGKSRNVGGD